MVLYNAYYVVLRDVCASSGGKDGYADRRKEIRRSGGYGCECECESESESESRDQVCIRIR
jgi:hypothetical protein